MMLIFFQPCAQNNKVLYSNMGTHWKIIVHKTLRPNNAQLRDVVDSFDKNTGFLEPRDEPAEPAHEPASSSAAPPKGKAKGRGRTAKAETKPKAKPAADAKRGGRGRGRARK